MKKIFADLQKSNQVTFTKTRKKKSFTIMITSSTSRMIKLYQNQKTFGLLLEMTYMFSLSFSSQDRRNKVGCVGKRQCVGVLRALLQRCDLL